MKTLLVINIRPELESDLVDYLLMLDCVGGFTSYPVRGHGETDDLTLIEQVSGHRRRLQFETLIDEEDYNRIIDGLKEQVGTDIVFWEQPVSRHGRV